MICLHMGVSTLLTDPSAGDLYKETGDEGVH
jgi:hypothetical protein